MSQYLVPDGASFGQALLGQRQAQAQHLLIGHKHRSAAIAQFKGDIAPFQVTHDRSGIVECQIGVEDRHLRFGQPHADEHEKADKAGGDGAHGGEPRRADRSDKLQSVRSQFSRPNPLCHSAIVPSRSGAKWRNTRGNPDAMSGAGGLAIVPTNQ